MKEITIYELIKLVKENKAPSKVIYNDKVWSKKGQDYYYSGGDVYLFLSVCKKDNWLDLKITAFDESENKSNENKDTSSIKPLKPIKNLNSDYGFGSCDMRIAELRLDMQTVKKWINDIVKVVNNGNR